MGSHDKSWRIERYPNWNGQYYEYSYGCPDLNLMGYSDITPLLLDMNSKIMDIEDSDSVQKKKGCGKVICADTDYDGKMVICGEYGDFLCDACIVQVAKCNHPKGERDVDGQCNVCGKIIEVEE